MSDPQFKSWQAIQAEVLRRIHARDWPPGHTIPNEVDLAREFGCARATVNRALQSLADSGLLERRRKAGTRVALHPVGKATLDIPVLRQEIETRSMTYGYRLVERALACAPAALGTDKTALHLIALHYADDVPYVIEDRWINLSSVPAAAEQPFDRISANEWLVITAPYTNGDISFTAEMASAEQARLLNTDTGAAVFVIDRTTWDHDQTITTVRLTYAPGYRIHTAIGTGMTAK